MQIAGYISKLLYHHDCVVIPNLGGFITNYNPARIHPVNHTFYPPSKSILFNPKLTRNDGLLIHNIAVAEAVPYETVKDHLEDLVQQIKTRLNRGEKVEMENIGKLYEDQFNTILFDPDESVNYLNESFGLPTFISPPILRESVQRRLEKRFSDRKPLLQDERERKRIYWAYAAVIPILIVLAWFIFGGNFNQRDIHQSGMIDINDSDKTRTGIIPGEAKSQKTLTEKVKPLKDLDLKESHLSPDHNKAEKKDAETDEPAEKTYFPKYYIIGGAFQFKDNAENLIADLRRKGYQAQDAGRNENGLYMVSYFSTPDKSEALTNLAIIRRNDNPAAWLFKK
jgi:hypothetical protein